MKSSKGDNLKRNCTFVFKNSHFVYSDEFSEKKLQNITKSSILGVTYRYFKNQTGMVLSLTFVLIMLSSTSAYVDTPPYRSQLGYIDQYYCWSKALALSYWLT